MEDIDNRLGSIGLPDKGKHELRYGKMERQQYLAAFPSSNESISTMERPGCSAMN